MEMFRMFEEPQIGANVFLGGSSDKDYLGIDDQGILAIPMGVRPMAFHLSALILPDARQFVVQKNTGQKRGGYAKTALTEVPLKDGNFISHTLHDPIVVMRAGSDVWTSYQGKTNRVDCWELGEDGTLKLFQVGIITHDHGKTWRLHGEYRWKGQLFKNSAVIVAKPEEFKWGPFTDTWKPVLDLPDFQNLLATAELQPWTGKPQELDPPLPFVTEPGYAVVQWYVPFMGQTGQGPVNLHNGNTAWVHGSDILDMEDSGVKRLWRGDILSYITTKKFGGRQDGPPKLVGVRKVSKNL